MVKQIALTVMYLGAVITANLIVSHFGTSVVLIVGFALIGLDLTSRDYLHEAWHHRHLWAKMFCLIALGSLLSWVLNRQSGHIALASFTGFACTGLLDTIAYHLLRNKRWWVRINGSNIVSAFADSSIFLTMAFGWMPLLVLKQFAVKLFGGFIWSFVLLKFRSKKDAVLHRDTQA